MLRPFIRLYDQFRVWVQGASRTRGYYNKTIALGGWYARKGYVRVSGDATLRSGPPVSKVTSVFAFTQWSI